MTATIDHATIRDAATIILLRRTADGPAVLMGQRGAQAVFMPDKFVFPGGAVDATDATVPVTMPQPCWTRLAQGHARPDSLAAAAIRELWEETGLIMGQPGTWPDAPPEWRGFAEKGVRPNANGLRFIFRAITPPGRPRRFDARFFLADAATIAGDLDDFAGACDELTHLHWVALADARKLSLPFITEVVLAEVQAVALSEDMPGTVPFFDNSTEVSTFRRID